MAAESLDDGEFWLPPKFLADNDDVFTETPKSKTPSGLKDAKILFGFDAPLFPLEFPYGFDTLHCGAGFADGGGFSSDLSSPVESVVGSTTETESSDEEDFLSGLTGQMGRSTLEDLDFLRDDESSAKENTKGRGVSGSPQSTLCSVGSGCGCGQGSSDGSPNGISAAGGVTKPPATWDLLFAAAGEVAKMGRDDELYGAFNNNNSTSTNINRVVAPPPRKPSPVSVPLNNKPDVGLYQQQIQQQQYQSLSYQKLQASQFHHMRQQQMIKQHQQHQQQQSSGAWNQAQVATVINSNRARNTNNNRAPLGLSSSAWPSLQAATNPPPPSQPQPQQQQQQPQPQTGMRAVFLGNPGAKRESVGTGVFLPRRIGTPAESRKKQGATVLLPAKVVQALNLNLEEMAAQPQFQPRFNGAFVPDIAAASKARKSNVSQQKQNLIRQQQGMNVELRLPQEWTY